MLSVIALVAVMVTGVPKVTAPVGDTPSVRPVLAWVTAGESLHIPTFASGASGPYLPGTAIKGALRTGMVFANWRDGMLQDVLERVKGERMPRRPAEAAEDWALGSAGTSRGNAAHCAASCCRVVALN